MKRNLPLIIFLLFFSGLAAQEAGESLIGLQENPVITTELKKRIHQDNSSGRELIDYKPILLPVFDDFQQTSPFPDTSIWIDDEVFINADFPYRSANVGAATFDAIDNTGRLYSNASTFPFIADHLTSKAIRLDSIFDPVPRAITISDSIYLSFYYQPQGRGNSPESFDSLVLQFGYNSTDSVFIYTDSIDVPASLYINPGDTIYPLDTIFSPSSCDSGQYLISSNYYTYNDIITLPCKDVYEPEIEWITQWSTKGMKLDTFEFYNGVYSKQIMIPITDSLKYFRKDFRFRFFNYASLATNNVSSWRSNCDQWNVDYIYLNIGRSRADSTYRDISFVEKAQSMLKRYQAMPYTQYRNDPTNSMKDTIRNYISNLYDQGFNTDYGYYVDQVNGGFHHFYDGGGCNLLPFYQFGYQRCDNTCGASRACPRVDFFYPISIQGDSAEFEIKHVISGFTAADTVGDTISFTQKFFNYYAYDDGTPEAGYGVNTAGGMVAYKFRVNNKDSLRAIRMYFNRVEGAANDQYFDLCVWKDNSGEPGLIAHREHDLLPKFSENLYQIQTYYLSKAVPVNSTFYIGWIQSTTDNLNVGFDTYNDASSSIFYNVVGNWVNTSYTGSIIMRPVIGKPFDPTGIDEFRKSEKKLVLYPNPTDRNYVNLIVENEQIQENSNDHILRIYNIYGQQLINTGFKRKLDISSFTAGIYIVQLHDIVNNKTISSKLIISR